MSYFIVPVYEESSFKRSRSFYMRSFFLILLFFEIFFSSSSAFPYTIGVVLTIPTSSSDLLDTELAERLRSILKF